MTATAPNVVTTAQQPNPGAPSPDVQEAVHAVARRARAAARELARATRATKDAALHAMADALVASTQEIVAANAVDLERGQAAGTSPGLLDRLTLTPERIGA